MLKLYLKLGANQRRKRFARAAAWLLVAVRWLLAKTPRDFGSFRIRWSCALIALLLWEQETIRASPKTIRRGLARHEFVWRRVNRRSNFVRVLLH